MAHHAQELGPQTLQLLQRSQVLQGDDHRLDRAGFGPDRRCVDQRRDAPAVGDPKDQLLGTYRPGVDQRLRQGELFQRDLPPVGKPASHVLQNLLQGAIRHAQPFDDPLRLPVERQWPARLGVEDRDAHGRSLDQGLQVGPGPLLVPVRAGVGDGRSRLGREQHQHLLVLARELPSAFLRGEKEVADLNPPMPHRRALQGLRPHQVCRKAEGSNIAGQIL